MLSSHTIHVLTGCLLDAEAHADTHGWRQPPMIILLRAQRLHPTHGRGRRLDTILLPIHPDLVAGHVAAGRPGGVTAVLRDLAQWLTDTAPGADVAAETDPAAGAALRAALADELLDQTGPEARLLGCGIIHEHTHILGADVRQVRRLDAVDADRRLYRLTRLSGQAIAVAVVDDHPHPRACPAYPGLVSLLDAAAAMLLSGHARQPQP